jgi:hypothetical protein
VALRAFNGWHVVPEFGFRSAGVPPAVSSTLANIKIAGETPALRKAGAGCNSVIGDAF